MIKLEYTKSKEERNITSKYYEKRALLARSLAHPLRVQLAHLLVKKGELCVCELIEEVVASQSNVSKHLAVLKNAGVVESRKEGLKVFYKVRTPCVIQFFDCLDGILEEEREQEMSL